MQHTEGQFKKLDELFEFGFVFFHNQETGLFLAHATFSFFFYFFGDGCKKFWILLHHRHKHIYLGLWNSLQPQHFSK